MTTAALNARTHGEIEINTQSARSAEVKK